MTEQEFSHVVDHMKLPNGAYWPLPVLLFSAAQIPLGEMVELVSSEGRVLAEMSVQSCFLVDKAHYADRVFKTTQLDHPGVKDLFDKPAYAVGGPIIRHFFSGGELTDVAFVREEIHRRGWKTVAAFHTRNPPHRSHEHLQRVALEICEGLIISPVMTGLKPGDISSSLIKQAYELFIDTYYPLDRVLFVYVDTYARFAGPREVVFQALIRKNYGATHFIVGRDMCGVGQYYGKYEAHDFFDSFPDIGIIPIKLKEPMYCETCCLIVPEDGCTHEKRSISGTLIRNLLSEGVAIPEELMRPEVSEFLAQHVGDSS